MSHANNHCSAPISAVILLGIALAWSSQLLGAANAASVKPAPETYALRGQVMLQRRGLANIPFYIRSCRPGQLTTQAGRYSCRQWTVRSFYVRSDRDGFWRIKRLPAGYFQIEVGAGASNPDYRIYPTRRYQWSNGRSSVLLRFFANPKISQPH